MKTRNGFVSNSSTSSFIVLKKDESMSSEDLKAKSLEVISGYSDYPEDYHDVAEKYAEDSRYIILMENVEYGGEEALDNIIPKLLTSLGIEDENISFEWSE